MTETCWSIDHDSCKGHHVSLSTGWQTRVSHFVWLLDRGIATCRVTPSLRNYWVVFSLHFRYLYARQTTLGGTTKLVTLYDGLLCGCRK